MQLVVLVGFIQGMAPCKPFELLNDGDFAPSCKNDVGQKETWLTGVTKVKGHANEEQVASGQVGAMDKAGNDDAADHGRRRVPVGCY